MKPEEKHEPKPEEKHEKVAAPAPKQPEVHAEPPKEEKKPEEAPKSDQKTLSEFNTSGHKDEPSIDHTSSFVKIGDSIPPQPEPTKAEVKVPTTTAPVSTQPPKESSTLAPKDHVQETKAPEPTPVVSHPTQQVDLSDPKFKTGEWDDKLKHGTSIGGSTENPYKEHSSSLKEPHHEKPAEHTLGVPQKHHADLTHSPIPHPPIPDPPIVQPPSEINLGNDKVPTHRDDKPVHHQDPKENKEDGSASNIWLFGIGFTAVAVGTVAFLKWKKFF